MLGRTSLLSWKCEKLFDTDVTGNLPERLEKRRDCLWSFWAESSASNFDFKEAEV